MFRVRVEKIGTHFKFEIDGKVARFDRISSDILTEDIVSISDFNGIFSTVSSNVVFFKGTVQLAVDFGSLWDVQHYADNPLAEIRRRVRLVQETFAKAEAEKEVWEGVVGELPLVAADDGESELYDVVLLNNYQVTRIVAKDVTLNEAKSWKSHWKGFFIVPSGKYKVGYKL
jgi:hypothetical protein